MRTARSGLGIRGRRLQRRLGAQPGRFGLGQDLFWRGQRGQHFDRNVEIALERHQTVLALLQRAVVVALKKDLDVPAEVLAALPTLEEIMAKAEAARLRAEAARAAAAADTKD